MVWEHNDATVNVTGSGTVLHSSNVKVLIKQKEEHMPVIVLRVCFTT